MTKERILRLEKINFIWDTLEFEWKRKYHLFKQYLKSGGDISEIGSHPALGVWVKIQRREMYSNRISKERFELLDQAGFIWEPHEMQWQSKYNLLIKYVEDNGHAQVPDRHPTLGGWVKRNRKDRKNGKLSKERTKLLESLNFIWETRPSWESQYKQLKQYIALGNDSRVPTSHPVLGQWVSTQRKARKTKKLSEERIKLLDELGFIWKTRN